MSMLLKNYMEDAVSDAVGSIMKEMDLCMCDKCVLDVKAIALNSLPPKYVVTKKGELYTKIAALQQQNEVDIMAAVTKAAVIVKQSPRHG